MGILCFGIAILWDWKMGGLLGFKIGAELDPGEDVGVGFLCFENWSLG